MTQIEGTSPGCANRRDPRFGFLALRLVVLALLAGTVGCASSTKFQSAWPRKEVKAGLYSVDDEATLRSSLSERAPHHPELIVDAGVKARYPGGSGFVTVRSLYQEPNRIRLRGSRLDFTIFDLVLEGDRAYLYIRDERARYDGTAEELARASGAIGGLSPRDLISAIQVQAGLRDVLESGRPVAINPEDEHFLIGARVGEGTGLWLVRRQDGLVREFLLRDPDGEDVLRVRYDAYELEGDQRQPMPSRLRIEIPPADSSFTLNVNEYQLDPTLRPNQFEPLKSQRVLPLSSLAGGTR